MTWTYSGDPSSSDLDEVRFYLGDTDTSFQLMSDEELTFLITYWTPLYGSNLYTAAVAAEMVAGKMASQVNISADGVTISSDVLQQKYNDLAMSLRDRFKAQNNTTSGPDVGGIMWGEEYDSTIKPLNFAIGMNDNPRAGQEDYGGTLPDSEWHG